MITISLDYKSRLPIYEQIYQSVTKMSALGAMKANDQLPSVRTLSQELGINPNTIQKAYQLLERDGIVYSIPGKGSFLSADSSAMEQQKKLLFKSLKEITENAIVYGIEKQTVFDLIETVYQRREQP